MSITKESVEFQHSPTSTEDVTMPVSASAGTEERQ